MNSISTAELLHILADPASRIILVNALEAPQFEMLHIPGSINLRTSDNPDSFLAREDDIVVYCTNRLCFRSRSLYERLQYMGYKKLRRYHGGLEEWESHGLALEGSRVLRMAC